MATRRLIHTTQLAEMRPLVHQGSVVYDAYSQLTRLVASRLSTCHADLLAEPVVDRGRTRIDWYARRDGDIRSWADMSEDEREDAERKVGELVGGIVGVADQLADSGDRHRETIGGILRLAMTVPDRNGIYLIGGEPVVAGWGLTLPRQDSENVSLTRFVRAGTGEISVQPTISRACEVAPAHEIVAATVPPAATAAPLRPAYASPPWWMLWLLAGLVCSSILVWFLRDAPPAVAGSVHEYDRLRQRELVLREQLAGLVTTLGARRAQCAPPPAALPAQGSLDTRRAAAGGKTGVVTVTLGWDTTDDLDLVVLSPRDEVLYHGNKSAASGGTLDVDANVGQKRTDPVENIVWQTDAPAGDYRIFVKFSGSNPSSVSFRVETNAEESKGIIHGSVAGKGALPDNWTTPARLKSLSQTTNGDRMLFIGGFHVGSPAPQRHGQVIPTENAIRAYRITLVRQHTFGSHHMLTSNITRWRNYANLSIVPLAAIGIAAKILPGLSKGEWRYE